MEGGEDYKLVINTSFILDNEVEITIKNININTLNKLNNNEILKLMMETKWYMYGNYDKCIILSEEYTILNKTKKKVELVRSNINKANTE
jgi:TRAP-type mannitol/chloroaromatic compound transport system permease small subunit